MCHLSLLPPCSLLSVVATLQLGSNLRYVVNGVPLTGEVARVLASHPERFRDFVPMLEQAAGGERRSEDASLVTATLRPGGLT